MGLRAAAACTWRGACATHGSDGICGSFRERYGLTQHAARKAKLPAENHHAESRGNAAIRHSPRGVGVVSGAR